MTHESRNERYQKHREIELRFEVPQEVWQRMQTDLFEASTPIRRLQVDEYFDFADASFLRYDPVRQWVRLRQDGDHFELNRKVFHYPVDSDVATHADEFSLQYPDRTTARQVLSTLGFVDLATVTKQRLLYREIPGVEVAFDAVDGVGWFIEIEALDQTDSWKAIVGQLESTAEKLGLEIRSQDRRGYPYLLLFRSGLL